MVQSMSVSPGTHGASPWVRVRAVGAVAAVAVFLGTAALAPFSISSAFALDGSPLTAGPDQQLQSQAAGDVSLVATDVEGIEVGGKASPLVAKGATAALFSLEEFLFSGVVNWSGYRFTFYSQQVLPGPGLEIPGRHVNEGGFVADEDGFIVLAGSHPKGTVFDTPFGHQGKIYDRGTFGNHLDVYIR